MKRAFIEKLRARPALANVAVSYAAPTKASDVTGPIGQMESIFFTDDGTDDGDTENVVICALPLQLDEDYTIPLAVQVLRPESDGSQEACDERVDELLYEVVRILAEDPTFGVSAFPYAQVTNFRFRRKTGGVGAGHGAGAEVMLQVKSRVSFTDP